MNFVWKILGITNECKSVRYFISLSDDVNTVESEGNHTFSDGVVVKPFEEIKEEDLIRWLDQDTTKDDVNIIKLNLEKQLESLKNSKNAQFPWLADTFTIE